VSFAVDGILLLGSLSITRAFLEVIFYHFAYLIESLVSNRIWFDSVLCDWFLSFLVEASLI